MSGHSVTDRQTDSRTYRLVSVVFSPLALWRAVVNIRSTGTGPGEVSLDPWDDRLGMHDVMIRDIMNLGKADVRGIRVGCDFGLDAAG